ncbi:MFS transporter [Streptomyces avermitilis]|uniref:MFS transporter n=1 Tax=Streptomyces avermitilis TaxID=33903 RepID=A0A4D4MI92_STRAX|nr:MFS transporter [Streptomyces avermitilis]
MSDLHLRLSSPRHLLPPLAPFERTAPVMPASPAVGPAGETPPAEPDEEAARKPPHPVSAPGGLRPALRSLKYRNYRLFVVGQCVSITGTWMQRAAQDWLVLSLTGSPTFLGVTIACQFLPYLLVGLWGGVTADRYRKRHLLMVTQGAMAVLALLLAVLALTGQVRVWEVNLLAFCLGLVSAVEDPARETFAAEMVGEKDLGSAVSLNSAVFQLARIGGPPAAGLLLDVVQAGWIFAGNAVSYLVVLLALLRMNPAELVPHTSAPRSPGQLKAALRHAAGRPELRYPILLMGLISVFAFNYPLILASLTNYYFHRGPGTYGVLNTVFALGCLGASFLVAPLLERGGLRLVVAAAVGIGVAQLAAAAAAPSLVLFALVIALAGVVGQSFVISANTWVQMNCEPEWRGRVMGIYMLVFMGGNPIGNPTLGKIAEEFGGRWALFFGGGAAALGALCIAALVRRSQIAVPNHPSSVRST